MPNLLNVEVGKRNPKGNLSKLLKSLSELNKETFEVGHFQEQGMHYSGKTFPELMEFHASGGDEVTTVPVRDPRAVFQFRFAGSKRRPVKETFGNNWLTGSSQQIKQDMLELLAKLMKSDYKSIFGDESLMRPTKPKANGSTAPLVDSGELKDNVAYKLSTDKRVVTDD